MENNEERLDLTWLRPTEYRLEAAKIGKEYTRAV